MIYLDATNRKLEIVLAGAITTNQLDVVVCFKDIPARTKPSYEDYLGATTVTNTNNTTDVTICAAPSAAGTVRDVSMINVYNKDTASATVTIKIDIAGTEYILVKQVLLTTETLHYDSSSGWQVI